MNNNLIHSLRWPSLAILVTTGIVGCAQKDRFANMYWAKRAGDVAAQRLADNPNQDQTTRANNQNPSVDRISGRMLQWNEDVNPFGRTNTTLELHRSRLVADAEEPEAGQELTADETPGESFVGRGPLVSFRDTLKRDLKEMPGVLWEDTKHVYTDPLNIVFLVGAGGASLVLRPEVDDDIEDYYNRGHSMSSGWREAFGVAGNPATHFALAGVSYLAGQQLQDAKTYEVSKRLFSALIINGASTMLLKVAANTESPNGEDFAWPSGHVSSTMTVATVLNDAYGPLVGVPMFGLTALVGLERLDDREHHLSDVVFGVALGWVVAETVMKEHKPEIFGGQITPYIDPINNNAGIAWVKTLGN